MATTVPAKLARIRDGGAPRVVDLFCGAGGFSLGFERAGCEILGGLELDARAIAAHASMFHGGLRETAPDLYKAHATPRDIRRTDPVEWLAGLGVERPIQSVDIIIGGPPCPAYTRVGRAKLREIHDHPEAYRHDPRATLYLPYLDWVRQLEPVALVMENVPEVLNFAGHNLGEEFCEVLEGLGYRCAYSIVNAASFGVPQMRSRFILVGIHDSVGVRPRLPTPTHAFSMPEGYRLALEGALKPLRDAGSPGHYTPMATAGDTAPPAVTTADALSGLPGLREHLSPDWNRWERRFLDERSGRPYPAEGASAWVRTEMLAWPGREVDASSDPVLGHITRALTWRDFRLFRHMDSGQDYFDAYDLALELFDARWAALAEARGMAAGELEAVPGFEARLAEFLTGLSDALAAGDTPSVSETADAWTAIGQDLDSVHAELESATRTAAKLAAAQDECATFTPEDPRATWQEADHLLRALQRRRTTTAPEIRDIDIPGALRALRRHARREAAWSAGLRLRRQDGSNTARVVDRASTIDALPAAAQLSADLHALIESIRIRNLLFWDPDEDRRVLWQLFLIHALRVEQQVSLRTVIRTGFVPPYIPDKFPNKWRKMEPDAPARTLMAHLGKDTYSHIHPDSNQARTITVREAARLQSFPDGFQFQGAMNAAFKQVGNAVPPLMAWSIATQVLRCMSPDDADHAGAGSGPR